MSDAGKARMRVIHIEIERLLNKIAEVLPVEYKLTLVARHTKVVGGDIILSVDDLDSVRRPYLICRKAALPRFMKAQELTSHDRTPEAP